MEPRTGTRGPLEHGTQMWSGLSISQLCPALCFPLCPPLLSESVLSLLCDSRLQVDPDSEGKTFSAKCIWCPHPDRTTNTTTG